jgi:hypothetical protein
VIRFKWFRWVRVVFSGYRSFSKNENGNRMYLLLAGNLDNVLNSVTYEIERLGFKEEWGEGN